MNILHLIQAAIRGAWRQRVSMIVPLVLIIPMALVVALAWPVKYQTSTLLLLQEYAGLTGSVPGYLRAQEMRDKIKGLEALIHSDLILRETMQSSAGDTASAPPTEREIQEFRGRVSVVQVGSDFVSISIIGTDRDKLENQLNTLLTVLFERLLSAGKTAIDAPSFLLEQRRQLLDALEARLSQQAHGGAPASVAQRQSELAAATEKVGRIKRELEVRYNELSKRIYAVDAGLEPEKYELAAIIERLEAEHRTLSQQSGSDPARLTALRSMINRLQPLTGDAQQVSDLAADLRSARAAEREATTGLAMAKRLAEQRKSWQLQAEALRASNRRFENRIGVTVGNADIQLLRAPAQIKVIDPPKRPKRPLTSRLKILLAGLFAAFAMSGALGVLGEQLDGRLRDVEALSNATGVPNIARLVLPPATASETLPANRPAPEAAA